MSGEGEKEKPAHPAYAYMVRCADGSLYSGYTVDVAKRVKAHNAGTGAKYTRARRPVLLAFARGFATKSEAMQFEAALKKLTKAQKEGLAATGEGIELCVE